MKFEFNPFDLTDEELSEIVFRHLLPELYLHEPARTKGGTLNIDEPSQPAGFANIMNTPDV